MYLFKNKKNSGGRRGRGFSFTPGDGRNRKIFRKREEEERRGRFLSALPFFLHRIPSIFCGTRVLLSPAISQIPFPFQMNLDRRRRRYLVLAVQPRFRTERNNLFSCTGDGRDVCVVPFPPFFHPLIIPPIFHAVRPRPIPPPFSDPGSDGTIPGFGSINASGARFVGSLLFYE